MSSVELNKIFAAVLVAGIVAMLGGFVADILMHPHELEEDAVPVEGAAVAGGGIVKQTLPDPIMHLIATADLAQGEKLSKACTACHSYEQDGPDKVGPNLWGIVGGPKAARDFAYSDALENAGGAWGYEDLNKFLWKPKSYIAGTKMNYIGMKKPEDRAAMIAWLRTKGSSGFPLPSDAEIAAEKAELAPEPPEPAEGEEAAEVPDTEDYNE